MIERERENDRKRQTVLEREIDREKSVKEKESES